MCIGEINVRNHGTCLVRRGNKKPYESVSDGTAFYWTEGPESGVRIILRVVRII